MLPYPLCMVDLLKPEDAMRMPKQYEPVWAIGANHPNDPMALSWSRRDGWRDCFAYEPAEPVIGEIIAWRYRHDDSTADDDAYQDVLNDPAVIEARRTAFA